MHEFFELLKTLVNPESIILYGGLTLLTFVIFAETGLFVGFFLPGDSLLFTAGILTAFGKLHSDIIIVLVSVTIAAITGSLVGYAFGKRVGPPLFKRKESLLFKPSHLVIAQEFFCKYGGRAIVFSRFLPIVRTFVPIICGVIKFNYKQFFLFNLIGAMLWVNSIISIGYFLGRTMPLVKNYLHYIIIFLIVVTAIPVYSTWKKSRKQRAVRINKIESQA